MTTVATEPEGLLITVDGQTWVSPVNFLWEPGSSHTVSVQKAHLDIGDTVRRRFLAWSDGGARQHSVVAGPDGGLLQARFATEYQVFVSYPVSEADVFVEPLDPGVVPPPSEWFPAGARLRFRAAPKSQTRFAGWTGDLNVLAEQFERGLDHPLSLLVNMAPPGNLRTDGVRNTAFYVPGDTVAPCEIVTLFGAGIGPEPRCSLEPDPSGKVTTGVCGVCVLFDGMPAPVLYASDRQVSAIVPFGTSGQKRIRLRLSFQGVAGEKRSLEVTETAPSLFTADSTERGQAAILNEDGAPNSPQYPAARGSVVALFQTGTGQNLPPSEDGSVSTTGLPKPVNEVKVYIGRIFPLPLEGIWAVSDWCE